MTKFEKLVEVFKKRPDSVSYKELRVILFRLGFEEKQGKGSHVKFSHIESDIVFIVPVHKNECRKIYKKRN